MPARCSGLWGSRSAPIEAGLQDGVVLWGQADSREVILAALERGGFGLPRSVVVRAIGLVLFAIEANVLCVEHAGGAAGREVGAAARAGHWNVEHQTIFLSTGRTARRRRTRATRWPPHRGGRTKRSTAAG